MISSIAWVRRGAAARVPTTEAGLHEVMAGQAPAEPAMAAASSSSSQRGKAAGKRRSAEEEAAEEDDDEEATPVLTAGNIM
jgi:ribosomal protein L12E/L44/L45/RPP1/RPP2